MPYPLPLTRTEAYLAYKAGVIQQSDLKLSLAVPRNGIDAWLAYWTGLAADYPKREDGTPHILQEEEAYIAYLCGVINEYPEKCLRRVGAYLRYLISARWGRPDHPLNREELYLSLIKTQFIPSGDPSSDIEIDGTAKAPFVDVKMYGDTYQQTFTGKNLLKLNDGTTTLGSVPVTVVNGTVNLKGTATSYAQGYYVPISITASESMVFSPNRKGNTSGLDIKLQYKRGETIYYPSVGSSLSLKAGDIIQQMYLIISNGSVLDGSFSPMLEVGSTATSFEPYVGGQPSPNPDYPQMIQTVTGEQTVMITGKNIYDPSLAAASGADNQNIRFRTPLEPSTQYTFNVTDSRPYAAVYLYNSDGVLTRSIGNFQSSHTMTFTTSASEISGAFDFYARPNVDVSTYDFTGVQLELGSATAYAPYSKQTYLIDLGNIELDALGDDGNGNPLYEDYIYPDFDEWKLHKATGKYSLVDGSELGENGIGADFVSMLTPELPTITEMSHNSGLCRSNMYIPADRDGTGLSGSTPTGRIRVYTSFKYANTYNGVRAIAQESGLVIYYPLNTPTDTVITNQNLINQLNALKQGGAEEGTTYIKVNAADPNLPGLLYVEAPKYE